MRIVYAGMIDTGAFVKPDRIASWKKVAVAATILSAFCFSTPYALGAENTEAAAPSDVTCILMGMGMDTSGAKAKETSMIGITYFVGRYQGGHTGDPDMALVWKEVERQDRIDPATRKKEQAACAATLAAAGRSMRTVSDDLKKLVRAYKSTGKHR